MEVEDFSQELCKALSSILKSERLKAGLSANKLAQLTGLSRQAITFIEKDDRIPSVDTFARIAHVLGKRPSQLWKEAEQIVFEKG